MADQFLAALGCARRALARVTDPVADAHLLERFVRERDEVAFAELVARHGPAVWAACRRGSPTAADAEDAFQATFLVLVRRADRVRRAASVGGWLFRIAVRLSARTRARSSIPTEIDNAVLDPAPDPAERAALRDLVAALETELAGLPDALRAALVSCYYEGLTQDDAARRLGWKVRTVRARVARGRELLRRRLARRGIDLSAALAAVAVGTDTSASLPQVNLTTAVGAMSPAVSELVKHGLEITAHAVSLRLAIGIAAVVAVAAAGVGYALVVGNGSDSRDGTSGQHWAAAPPSGVPQPRPDPFDWVSVYDRAVDGCVYIVRETNGAPIEGTGALIDKENRLVLTTYRVVGDSDVVSVQFPYHNLEGSIDTDRTDYARAAAAKYLTPRGRVIRRDKTRDLALVQLDRLSRRARPLELAEPSVQKTVLHIGAGTGGLFSMTVRKFQINAPALTVPATSTTEVDKAPKISVSGTTDDSGGALVNREGKLVGIATGSTTEPTNRPNTVAMGIAEIRAFLAAKDEEAPVPPMNTPAPPIETPPLPPDLTTRIFGPLVNRIPPDVDGDVDEAKLYDKVVKSCVYILAPAKGGLTEGSGVLIDAEQKLVLTTCRVVEDQDKVFVVFSEYVGGALLTDMSEYKDRMLKKGKGIKGKVLFRDRSRDLAIVKLDTVPTGTPAIPLAKASPRPNSSVWQIGNANATKHTFRLSRGEVSAVGHFKGMVGAGSEAFELNCKMVTATNPVSEGNRGGPLYDKRGCLVAVTENGGPSKLVSQFVDVTEVRALLKEHKILIKELSDESVPDGPLDPEDLYAKVVRSCVYIITPIKGIGLAQGTGSLIDAEQRLVLTNYHVVGNEDQVYCQFPLFVKGELMTDKEKYKERYSQGLAITAKVMFRDRSRDLALIKLEKIPIGTEAIPLAKSSPKLGTTVWQIGNAGAIRQLFRVSKGEVSAIRPEKFRVNSGDGTSFEINVRMVTATAPTNPGDSGGPLYDKRGCLVAVAVGEIAKADLVSRFIDITEVRAFLDEKRLRIKELSDEPDPTPPKRNKVTPQKTDTERKGDDASQPSAEDEKAAADKLRIAKLFANFEDVRETYMAKLQEIVKKWPNTEAGKQAKKLLEKLK